MTGARGDIWLVDFGEPVGREQAGRRPAVVISDDLVNDGPSGLVIVVPVTSTHRQMPSHIELDDPSTGLNHVSYAKCEDIKSISDHRLITRLGRASPDAVFEMERVLRLLLRL